MAAAAGEAGSAIYEQGDIRASGLASVEAYLTRRAGMFTDVVEQLVSLHLQKGDTMSALITGEWCAAQGVPSCLGIRARHRHSMQMHCRVAVCLLLLAT